VFVEAAAMPGIEICGLAVHIGSQLTELEPYRHAFERIAGLAVELRQAGFAMRRLDLGGGLGIAYGDEVSPSLKSYADIVRSTVAPLGLPLIFEPGRRIVGNAGVLVTRVVYVKQGVSRNFVIVDAAMNDLIRPALYEAYHDFVPAKEPADDAASQRVDIVGPICESTDIFAEQRPMPPIAAGDLLVIRSTGAYGAVMASSYNLRLPAPEVMVRGNDYAIVRPRPSYQDIIGRDRLPDWLGGTADEAPADRLQRRSR
jgi:diaminopimelate decarboxylase